MMEIMMDGQHQKRRDINDEEQEEGKQASKDEIQQTKHQTSSQSPTSSPAHEFSFTVTLQPPPSPSSSSPTTSTACTAKTTTHSSINIPDKAKSSPAASFALDLSPADEIFFHGHLLPLRLLSHLPVSPRSSTNSLDSFTLPVKELYDQDHNASHSGSSMCNNSSSRNIISDNCIEKRKSYADYEKKGRSPSKSKSFSLFGLSSKWRKENNVGGIDAREKEDKERQKRKLKFDNVSHILKRYMRMVKPLLSFGSSNRRGNHIQFHRQGYSYSGNLSLRRKPEFSKRRGEFSAPASMGTSPTNSGLLVPRTGTLSTASSTSDSTMEELQAAIQAAIAHCKNSIAMEEKKIKCHHDSV